MPSFSRYRFPALVAVFAAACLYGLREDIALLSLTQLASCWGLILLASLCLMLNYAFRIVRWRRYLAKLGHSLPVGFAAAIWSASMLQGGSRNAHTLPPFAI
jgi:hypothetical protein